MTRHAVRLMLFRTASVSLAHAHERGRVEDGRGGDVEVAPFPVPAHQTGRADFPHPAFRQASLPAHGDTNGRLRRAVQLPRKSSDPCGVVRLIANHRPSTSSKARLKQGSFPSTAITRLHQYYDPLRLPPGAHRRVYGTHAPPQWVSHVARITFPTCRAHYPGGPDGGFCRPSAPSVLPSPVSAGRHPQLHFRGLLRLHSHSAHRIARPPKAAFVTRLQHRQLSGDTARQLPACRLLSGWILPPLVIRAFVAHRDARGPEDNDKPGFILGGSASSPVENWSGAPSARLPHPKTAWLLVWHLEG